MIVIALVFIFFTLLAIAYEVHTLTERTIEIGTIIENANRRNLRASGVASDDDFASESIIKAHRKWAHVAGGIIVAGALVSILLAVLGLISRR
jgi:hypothetical protein